MEKTDILQFFEVIIHNSVNSVNTYSKARIMALFVMINTVKRILVFRGNHLNINSIIVNTMTLSAASFTFIFF